jgi:hypothetical protein
MLKNLLKLKYTDLGLIPLGLLFFTIVFPNSFRNYSIIIFFLTGVMLLITLKKIETKKLTIFLTLSVYTLLSILKGLPQADPESTKWVIFVYIISPAIWLLIWTFIIRNYPIHQLTSYLIKLGILGCLSVFLFFYLFLTKGPSALYWIIESPNVLIKDGEFSATMHVFGSLIFIGTGIFATPKIIKNKLARIFILALFLIVGIISGRSALILSLGLGTLLNFLKNVRATAITISIVLAFATGVTILSPIILNGDNIDMTATTMSLIKKISTGGGEARQEQFRGLIEGIVESPLIGVGHGVPASIIRNDDHSWKYELLAIATVYHVGILGFILYTIPTLLVFNYFYKITRNKSANEYDIFIISGYTGILIASCTNPYLESFDFQWMAILPFVYFFERNRSTALKSARTSIK